MKNRALLALFLAIGISIGISQLAQADIVPPAANTSSQSGSDLAGDVIMQFAFDSENESNLADVYGFCTEGPQQRNLQDDPRKFLEYPRDEVVEPAMVFASFSPDTTGNHNGGGRRGGRDRDRDRRDDDDTSISSHVPEPAAMLMLGIGTAGLLPLAYRRRKQN